VVARGALASVFSRQEPGGHQDMKIALDGLRTDIVNK